MRTLVVLVTFVGVACSGAAEESGVRGCPRSNWPGPWTACAEADWVERVVEAGGYDVVGGTGSALTAEGGSRAFYVWTTGSRLEESQPVDDWRPYVLGRTGLHLLGGIRSTLDGREAHG